MWHDGKKDVKNEVMSRNTYCTPWKQWSVCSKSFCLSSLIMGIKKGANISINNYIKMVFLSLKGSFAATVSQASDYSLKKVR